MTWVAVFLGVLFLVSLYINLENENTGRRQWVVIHELKTDSLKVENLENRKKFSISINSPNVLMIDLKKCRTKNFDVGDTVLFVNLKKSR
ncbi:MAG: hypothetical protein LiPW41_326 [Parcubacteria group bacterium LiPW_41]|nr:MAG: hypothetical protein LiPW41_326 [Parcubacteria group bacterium LiPW_41]